MNGGNTIENLKEKPQQNTFYTAKYDLVFKRVMVKQEKLLKKILEKVLDVKINEIIYLDKEISPSKIKKKNKILDMVVKTDNKTINIELNSNKKEIHNYRNAAYIFNIYSNTLDKSEEYEELMNKDFISINLSYGIKDKNKIITTYKMQDEEQNKFIENLTVIEINMDLLSTKWYNQEVDKDYKYFAMLDMSKKELKKFCKGDVLMEEYKKEVEEINEDNEYKFFLSDEKDAEMLQRYEINEARKIGLEQGIEKGLQEGIEKGVSENKKENAINLYKNSVSKELIIKSLNISKETLEEYLKELESEVVI